MTEPLGAGRFARVVVDVGPAHLDRLFDYSVEEGQRVGVGSRVRVRFNGRPRTAWVADVTGTPSVEEGKVKPLVAVDGDVRWFDSDDLTVWRWVADRFAGTMSGAIAHALPKRIVRVEHEAAAWGSAISDAGEGTGRPPCAGDGWRELDGSALLKDAWEPAGRAYHLRPPLLTDPGPLLADLVARTVANGRTAIVMAPGPAPGPLDDVVAALGQDAVDFRRIHGDADRYRAFLRLRTGHLKVAVGERGLALMPVPNLGLIVVTDEANPAYKERRNPRHHVREAALARGRMLGATVVLTSSLLSAHAHKHLDGGHLVPVRADRATERAGSPAIRVIDRTALPPSAKRTRLSGPITTRVNEVVAGGGTVIVLAAAKGSGASLACTDCRSRHECRDCGAGLTDRPPPGVDLPDDAPTTWRCQVCGWAAAPYPCIDCGGTETFPLRAGAKRLATELAKSHPDATVAHMEGFDQPGPASRPSIAVMTRGSVVARPDWLRGQRADLLVIADPDVLLGRPDVDAAEDALRLWLDGAALANEVLVQTTQPEHPALQALVRLDPDGFWPAETERRAPLGFPPVGSLIRFTGLTPPLAATVRERVPGQLLGPDADGVALLKTDQLRGTLTALGPLRQQWGSDDARVRVDVDPVTST